jgi:hypothetical protein
MHGNGLNLKVVLLELQKALVKRQEGRGISARPTNFGRNLFEFNQIPIKNKLCITQVILHRKLSNAR